MPNNLTLQINVAGGPAARQALNQIGRAIRDTAESAEKSSTGFGRFQGAFSGISAAFRQISEGAGSLTQSLAGAQSGLGDLIPTFERFIGIGAAAAFVALSKSAADATRSLEIQAITLGLSVERFEGLRYAALVSGVSVEGFTRGIDRFVAGLGRAVQEQDAMAAAARNAAEHLQRAETQISDTALATANSLARAATAAQEAKNALIDADRGMDTAQRGLVRAKQALADFYKPPSEAELRARREAELKENVKLAEDAVSAADRRREIARQKAAEANAAILQEQRRGNAAMLAAMQEHWKAMDEIAAQGSAAAAGHGGGVSQQLREVAAGGLGGAGRDLIDQLGQYADRLNQLRTAAEQAAVARQDFGRGFAEILPLLRLGSQGINELVEASKQFTTEVTPAEQEMSRQFIVSWTQMTTAVEGLRRVLGNIIGQLFSPIFSAIAQYISRNSAMWQGWAQIVVNVVQGAFAKIKAVADLIASLWGGSGSSLLVSIGLIASGMTAISVVLGAMSLVMGPLSGGWRLFSESIRLATTAARLFTATPLGITLSLIAIAALEIYENWDKIGPVIQKIWNAFEDFASWITTGLVDAFKTVVYWINYVISLAEKAIAAIGGVVGSVGGAGGATAITPGFARGGSVRGAGGTDNVPAWLTAGEFVQSARAVQHYGVGFMSAINSLRMPRFALGGLVEAFGDAVLPQAPLAFAGGGMVPQTAGAARTPIHLHIGGESYQMEADSSTATRLTRYSTARQARMTGTAPSWKSGTSF
jgi:hypothetical protein